MRPFYLPLVALGLLSSCRGLIVLHDRSLGIGSYASASSSQADGGRYTSIRGSGLLVGRSALTLELVDRRQLSMPPAHT